MEILEGAKTILSTEFIAVDYGPEKERWENDFASGHKLSFSKNFEIERASSRRYTAILEI